MKALGIILMVIGLCWAALCFLGTSMMSRSVDMLTEAMLPALIGIVVAAIGVVMAARSTPTKGS
jgi:hypothetical protein